MVWNLETRNILDIFDNNNLCNFVMGYIERKCHIAEEPVSKIVLLVLLYRGKYFY